MLSFVCGLGELNLSPLILPAVLLTNEPAFLFLVLSLQIQHQFVDKFNHCIIRKGSLL